MQRLAATVVCGLLLVGSSGCVCSCGECGFIPALLVGGAVHQTQVNIARIPVRKDLAVVLRGEPEPASPDRARYDQAAARLERYGRRANEVIDQEHWKSWRKPRLLAGRDYPTALRLTARADPDWSLSMALAIQRALDKLLVQAGDARDAGDAVPRPSARQHPVPATVRPRLLALREELNQLIAELKPRVTWREEAVDGVTLTVRQTPSSR
jgi:hypothetical protein